MVRVVVRTKAPIPLSSQTNTARITQRTSPSLLQMVQAMESRRVAQSSQYHSRGTRLRGGVRQCRWKCCTQPVHVTSLVSPCG
jgi:hypothetical protein